MVVRYATTMTFDKGFAGNLKRPGLKSAEIK
jgi:hypothetical protein